MSPELKAAVSLVLQVDGLYVVTMPGDAGAIVPLVVNRGRIYSLRMDSELDPDRFNEGAKFTGPVYRFP